MIRLSKPARKQRTPRPAAAPKIDNAPPTIVEPSDGDDSQAPDGRQGCGSLESYERAHSARDAVGDEALAPGETLQEALHEIGVADWIDAETGEPAEGESPPHLREQLRQLEA